jgi:hypothetical protein
MVGRRECVLVTIPRIAEPRHQESVVGVYTSVETVRETGEGGGVEVIMACANDAGGSIPKWVQNMAMAGQVLGDGEKFWAWIRAGK